MTAAVDRLTSVQVRLSILTPVYNGARYLERCAAVVAQQARPEVEHVIVDGGSTDGSLELLAELERRHPHLRFVSEPDRGQSDALNKGVALARGEIIGVLNVDDSYEPGVLRRVLDLFAGLEEPALVVGNCNLRRDDGTLWFVNRPRRLRLWQLLLGNELVPFPLNPSAYFYHRSLHCRVGPYDEGLDFAMDLDFLLRAVGSATVRYVDETWGNFILSPQCKTVAAGQTGIGIAERDAVYRRHRRQLPPVRRALVAGLFEATHSRPFFAAQFAWRRPDLAAKRLLQRVVTATAGKGSPPGGPPEGA